MQTFSRIASVITLAAALVSMPSNASAQSAADQEQELEACTAEISPSQVAVGSNATRVTIALSEIIGAVTGVLPSEEAKRITMSSETDMPRLGMTADEKGIPTIEQGTNESSWIVWLNTSRAAEGMQMVTFVAGENHCVGELEIVPAN